MAFARFLKKTEIFISTGRQEDKRAGFQLADRQRSPTATYNIYVNRFQSKGRERLVVENVKTRLANEEQVLTINLFFSEEEVKPLDHG